ncbi:putative RNA-directed RNA polymerase [Rosa chinensis]|uniref:RNA-dependent RNA polymerase n=2 Tax=Rosa chinensis TaxID=74649 RepID=A0A2P6PXV2_ROSCH|nr:putative RNA-directed RNA polymerase [Rosa chinensis]
MESHRFLNHGSPPILGSCSMESINPHYTYLNNTSCAMEDSYSLGRCETETLFRLYDVRVEIGTLVRQDQDEFLVAWEGPPKGVAFTVDPSTRTCRFCLTQNTAFSYGGRRNKRVRTYCDYKVEFLVRDISEFKHYETLEMDFVILLRLAWSPCVSCRSPHDESWIRTTDFTANGAIGRSNFYKFSVPRYYGAEWNKAVDYLRQLRVLELDIKWPLGIQKEPFFEMPSSDPFYSIGHKHAICFEIIFLVNAVMHKGILNQHQLSDSFFDLLRSQSKDVNVAALNYLYSCSRRPVLDACQRLRAVQDWFVANPELFESPKRLDDIAHVRRLVITPTKAYCIPPEAQLSNRVLRKYKQIGDRFLRVTFMDEGMQTIYSNAMNSYGEKSCPQRTKVFGRVEAILKNGFDLCGRKYSFLAFSSNQLRERSAWFFAECKSITIQDIQTWMGKFTNRNVAKYSARMGQCFSSTYATVEVPSSKVNPKLRDIERNGYNFSDGIGKISPALVMEVAKKLKLDCSDPPCAYQIRYAGFKGVIACWPSEGDRFQLSLRPSMNKFESHHTTLEICSWTRLQPGFLNRQIITLLSTLHVPDMVFWRMQQQMVSNLKLMLTDMDAAFDVVTASCGEQGNAAAIMLSAGFNPQTEPHLRGMLTCIQAAQLWGLREKSRIFVPSGRWLMGCLDELGVLEQGQCFIQVSNPSLENCFAKHGSRFCPIEKNLQVIKGLVVVAKNPCLHPGDIRILEAVDAPGLHHLHDCLVFPQKGYRPHSNEASGSDLDGDLYFVTWDENLIPRSKKSEKPMEYDAAEAKTLDRPVTNQDIIEFFVRNMANENLGAICNAHVVHADISEHGASDDNCIKLAKLAAIAVDLPKTGKIVPMPSYLKPELYPDFMGKEGFKSYMSTKILGLLYRQITDAYDEDLATSFNLGYGPTDIPYDIDLEVPGAHNIVVEALERKRSYDFQLKGLMGQYNVVREEEIVTGYVWSMPKSRKRGELQEQLKQSYSALKKEFRQCFERIDGDFKSLSNEQKNFLYEQKASAWYMVTYHPKLVKESLYLQGPDGPGDVPMLSFAWIATDYLARIKIKRCGVGMIDSRKPINSLRRYLADRIRTAI